LIGLERDCRDKVAGFRTLIFICVGACLFTILPTRFAPGSDLNRVATNIVTGVGFLGAGVTLVAGMIFLWLLPPAEHRIDSAWEMREYELTCAASLEKYKSLEQGFTDCCFGVQTHNQTKTGDQMVCS